MKKKRQAKTLSDFSKFFDDKPLKELIAVKTEIPYTKQEHGMTISIDKLPECSFKELLTSIVENPSKAKIVIIAALEQDQKSWRVFAGWPDVRDLKVNLINERPYPETLSYLENCESIRTQEQVLMLGEVLDRETALKLFPDFSILEYGE